MGTAVAGEGRGPSREGLCAVAAPPRLRARVDRGAPIRSGTAGSIEPVPPARQPRPGPCSGLPSRTTAEQLPLFGWDEQVPRPTGARGGRRACLGGRRRDTARTGSAGGRWRRQELRDRGEGGRSRVERGLIGRAGPGPARPRGGPCSAATRAPRSAQRTTGSATQQRNSHGTAVLRAHPGLPPAGRGWECAGADGWVAGPRATATAGAGAEGWWGCPLPSSTDKPPSSY